MTEVDAAEGKRSMFCLTQGLHFALSRGWNGYRKKSGACLTINPVATCIIFAPAMETGERGKRISTYPALANPHKFVSWQDEIG